MGCSGSKDLEAGVQSSTPPCAQKVPIKTITAKQHSEDRHDDTLSQTAKSVALQVSANARNQLKQQEDLGPPGKFATDQDQRNANSLGGSSNLDSSEKLGVVDEEFNATDGESKHSDMLTNLKQEIGKDNEFTAKVVRMEDPFDTPIEIVYEGVHDGPILGEGISGVVREVVHRATGVHYAMKCLPYSRMTSGPEGLEQLSSEIFIMCQLDLPYIVRIEEVYASSDEMYIVQELCSGGELFDRLEDQPDFHYTEAHCAKLVKQMATALRYLHNKGIVHRDLKLENFLFASPRPDSELKMIDFGLSKHFEAGECHREQVGTPYAVAPEVIMGTYDEKCDVWALGVITYLLLCGETPFGGLDGESLLSVKKNILRAEIVFEPQEAWDTVSNAGKAFVSMLLNPDPAMRPTAQEVQCAEWIQVWAVKSSKDEKRLNQKTVSALMDFKKFSDMKKLLSEVLSFTLMTEQIVDLRHEFEKIDTEGDGEISLHSLKKVLLQNAEVGALGTLTEQEVEELFDSLKLNKSETPIRWHEFLAASLSQAKIDDRNLRLAFDRLDASRKGFLVFDDMTEVLGDDDRNLELIWRASLEECNASSDRITFHDFKKILKGRPKAAAPLTLSAKNLLSAPSLLSPPARKRLSAGAALLTAAVFEAAAFDEKSSRRASNLFDISESMTSESTDHQKEPNQISSREIRSQSHEAESSRRSSLLIKSPLYRYHIEMRHAVMEASKRFDQKLSDLQTRASHSRRASLIMKRGDIEIKYHPKARRASEIVSVEAAGERSDQFTYRARKKSSSDVRGMM